MDIYLVRHGEAAAKWGQSSDPGLSELGRVQARGSAEALLPCLSADVRLVSSPLQRARETALELSELLGNRAIDIDGAYSEIPAPVPLEQRQQWLRAFMQEHWDEQPEQLHQWRRSILSSLGSLESETVVFSHFLVINTVVGSLQRRGETLCCWPDNAAIVHLRKVGSSLELIDLGRQMQTVVN